MDKAGLEALACGIPVLATNSAFQEMLAPYGLFVPTLSGDAIADTVESFLRRADHPAITATLRNKIVTEHSLTSLIPKILTELR